MLGGGGWLIRQSARERDVSKAVKYFLDSIDHSALAAKKRDALAVASVLQEMHEFGYYQVAKELGLKDAPADVRPASPTPVSGATINGLLPKPNALVTD